MKRSLFATFLLLAVLLPSRQAAGQAAPGSLDDQLLTAARCQTTEWSPDKCSGKSTTVRQLLEKGANIEARDSDGDTALILAAEDGQADVVKVLIEKGADIEGKSNSSESTIVGSTALIVAASASRTEIVRLLLKRGANIEAKTSDGETALHKAAYSGGIDVVRLLLENGANLKAKDADGATALTFATRYRDTAQEAVDKGWGGNLAGTWKEALSKGNELVQLLEQEVSKNPQTVFAQSVADYQRQGTDALREKVIKLALSFPSLPPIPEDARQLFLQAAALMKQSTNPKEMEQPIWMLRKALGIAPWWGIASYNLSRALELDGQYDESVKQLEYYLELKPSEADANEARAHISVILAEKDAAERRKQQNESMLDVKYVSGGITRLRLDDAPKWWSVDNGIDVLYTYLVPEEMPFYINVFRFPNGHFLAITLIAQSINGAYAGDRIGAYDITNNSCTEGNDFAFGAQDYMTSCGSRYYVSVSSQPNATVTVTYPATGASVTVPVTLLYRGRAHEAIVFGGCGSGTVRQGGTRVMVLHFDCSVVLAAEDPAVNAAGLTPTTVKPE